MRFFTIMTDDAIFTVQVHVDDGRSDQGRPRRRGGGEERAESRRRSDREGGGILVLHPRQAEEELRLLLDFVGEKRARESHHGRRTDGVAGTNGVKTWGRDQGGMMAITATRTKKLASSFLRRSFYFRIRTAKFIGKVTLATSPSASASSWSR